MEILEQIWDWIGSFFGGIASGFERSITSLFGSSNARYIRKLQPRVAAINALEPKYQALTDDALRNETVEFRKRLAAGGDGGSVCLWDATSGERLPDLVRQDSIVASHSLIPQVMKHFFSGLAALLDPSLPLVRREHELIASTVSALNRCTY